MPFTITMWVNTSQSAGLAGLATKYAGSFNGWNVYLSNGDAYAWYYRTSTNFVSAGRSGLAEQ